MSNVKESTIPGMQDQLLEVVYSTMAIEEKARNELSFFAKNDREFTNMKASNAFARHETFWLKGINLDIYNKDGDSINWFEGPLGLRKFLNEGTFELVIGSKSYMNKMPLRNLIRVPDVGSAREDEVIVMTGKMESPMLIIPQALKLEGGMDFHVNVIGEAGEYGSGFTKETRLQVNLYGMLGRPVQ